MAYIICFYGKKNPIALQTGKFQLHNGEITTVTFDISSGKPQKKLTITDNEEIISYHECRLSGLWWVIDT